MTEEAIIDELARLAIDWALEEEPVGTTAEVTDIVEVDPLEWVTDTSGITPDRAFVVNILLDDADVKDETDVESEREVSAVYGYDREREGSSSNRRRCRYSPHRMSRAASIMILWCWMFTRDVLPCAAARGMIPTLQERCASTQK